MTRVRAYFCVTYFSISLFLQVRGAQEDEEEDEGVLGSVLLLSPLLVEGISVDTQTQVTRLVLEGGFSNYFKLQVQEAFAHFSYQSLTIIVHALLCHVFLQTQLKRLSIIFS